MSTTERYAELPDSSIGRPRRDLTGEVYDRLTVVREDLERAHGHRRYWWCRCECGNEVSIRQDNIGSRTWGCGCSKGKAWYRPSISEDEQRLREKWSNRTEDDRERSRREWRDQERRLNGL